MLLNGLPTPQRDQVHVVNPELVNFLIAQDGLGDD